MQIRYEVKDIDKNKIIKQYGIQKNGNTRMYASNRAFLRMQKYVPFDTGALSLTATVKPGSVTYEVPYAHRQYVENKGKGIRGKYWDQKMWSAEGHILTQEVEAYMKKMKG